jgi:hypothetical protein
MGANHDALVREEIRNNQPKKTKRRKPKTGNAETAALLRSAASALEHGRVATASKKIQKALGGPLAIFVEGGIVQTVLRVNSTAPKGYRFAAYELVDYDVFDTESGEDIKEIWDGFSPELQAYFRNHLKAEYGKFQRRISGI